MFLTSFHKKTNGHIDLIIPYWLKSYIDLRAFLYILPMFSKYLLQEHLSTMVSISRIYRDSIVTTRDSFKYCILACKIENPMHKTFKKRKSSTSSQWEVYSKMVVV